MPKALDDCVAKVMSRGQDEGTAFAICKKALGLVKNNSEKMESKVMENVKEKKKLKYDEHGNIIIAENVNFNIDSSITTIEE